MFPPCGLKLIAGISSQRGVRRVEGSNGGLNGACSEAVIHKASAWGVIIGRRGRAGANGLTEAEGLAPLIAARNDGRYESLKRCQRGII